MSDKQVPSDGPLEAGGRWGQYWKLYGTVLGIVIVTGADRDYQIQTWSRDGSFCCRCYLR